MLSRVAELISDRRQWRNSEKHAACHVRLPVIGHSDVINKSDGPKKKAAGQAEIRSTPEESPPAEPKGNVHVRCAVKEVTGMIRRVRANLRTFF